MVNNPKSTTGGEFDVTQEPFAVHTTSAVVGFNIEDADPPPGLYIDLSDQLAVTYALNGSTSGLIINLRVLALDGEIKPIVLFAPPNNSLIPVTKFFPLLEGFILSCGVILATAPATSLPLWVQVGIARPPLNPQSIYATLIAGYVNSAYPLCYPAMVPIRSTDGPGFPISAVTTLPGAGTDISFTVPAGLRWRIISFLAALTTSAAVANRLALLVIDDGVNNLIGSPSNVSQVASTSETYMWGDSMQLVPPFNTLSVAPLPSNIIIPSGFRIRTQTAGLQGGDAWSTGRMLVMQYNENY